MRISSVWSSIIVPWPVGDQCEVKEVEIETVFRVYPGEKETRDHPGCDPETEEIRTAIYVPMEGLVREIFFLKGSIRDLVGDDEMEDIVSLAIQAASEDDQDAKEFAAETRRESDHDMD